MAAHPFSPQCQSLGKMIHYLELEGVEVFNACHRDAYTNLMAQTFFILGNSQNYNKDQSPGINRRGTLYWVAIIVFSWYIRGNYP